VLNTCVFRLLGICLPLSGRFLRNFLVARGPLALAEYGSRPLAEFVPNQETGLRAASLGVRMNQPIPDTDVVLMRRATRGDRAAFGCLVERYQAALRRVAVSRLGDAEAAEDVVQETFFAAFRSKHTYNEQYAFRTWLWTILLNQCRRHAGKQARAPRYQSLDGRANDGAGASAEAHAQLTNATTDPQPAALSLLLAQERREQLDALLAQLSDAQADALRLRFFGGLQFQEIAACMECSLCTAKNRVRCGLLRLSQMISDPAGGLQTGAREGQSSAHLFLPFEE